MPSFLRPLQQRKLLQWALAYMAGAFALLQGVDIIAQQFDWPDWIRRAITLALAPGFCVVLVLAWNHGKRRTQRVTGKEVLILALVLGIGGALLWRFAPAPQAVPSTAPVRMRVAAAANAPVPTRSIAVLPFADLSPGQDQEYFSDGIAEEILNALTHIRDLKVAGRTSSFQFKGRNEDSRGIGTTLAVAHVLEGSVRKQDGKVRITTQLIRTEDGYDAADLVLTGYRYQGDKVLDRLLEVDPMLPNAKLAFAGFGLSLVAEARHQQVEAIEQLAAGLKGVRTGLPDQSNEMLARGILGDEDARRAALAMIDDYLETKPALVSRMIAYGLMRVHEPARAFALAQEQPARNDIGVLWVLWSPYGREFRTQPESRVCAQDRLGRGLGPVRRTRLLPPARARRLCVRMSGRDYMSLFAGLH